MTDVRFCLSDDKSSGEHLMVGEAAEIVGVTGAAIRTAIAQNRLVSAHVSLKGVHILHRSDVEVFKAAREKLAQLKAASKRVWRGAE